MNLITRPPATPGLKIPGTRGAAALAVLATLCCPAFVAATIVKPLTDDQLITSAELIFQGVVSRIDYRMSSVRTSADARLPHTFVGFQVERVLKGKYGSVSHIFTLRLEGGSDPNARRFMRVEGCPDFDIGERVVLFVRRNQLAMCPIAGWSRGRFRIVDGSLFNDGGREVWLTPPNKLAFGPRRDLAEVRTHHRGGSRYAHLVAGPAGGEATTAPPPMTGTRLTVSSFLSYVSSRVSALHPSSELSQLPAVPSAAPDRPFYVARLTAVGSPGPQK